jgi:septum formation protein
LHERRNGIALAAACQKKSLIFQPFPPPLKVTDFFRLNLYQAEVRWAPHKPRIYLIMKLVLASTSPFRRQLLERLQLPFETDSPQVDETPLVNEDVQQMVIRLAVAKAREVGQRHPDALIIGSDQSAELNGHKLTKPGSYDNAFKQLKQAAGKHIVFHTGLCLLHSDSNRIQTACVDYSVVFRRLTDSQIDTYLRREQPWNCAGSFKSEALGIALFERFEGEDPNALTGLPLIKLVTMLEHEGMPVL